MYKKPQNDEGLIRIIKLGSENKYYEDLGSHICEIVKDSVVWGMLRHCLKNKGKVNILQNSHH